MTYLMYPGHHRSIAICAMLLVDEANKGNENSEIPKRGDVDVTCTSLTRPSNREASPSPPLTCLSDTGARIPDILAPSESCHKNKYPIPGHPTLVRCLLLRIFPRTVIPEALTIRSPPTDQRIYRMYEAHTNSTHVENDSHGIQSSDFAS